MATMNFRIEILADGNTLMFDFGDIGAIVQYGRHKEVSYCKVFEDDYVEHFMRGWNSRCHDLVDGLIIDPRLFYRIDTLMRKVACIADERARMLLYELLLCNFTKYFYLHDK